MSVTIRCPGCKHRFQVSDDKAGRRIRCPECDEVVDLPTAQEAVTDAPSAPRGSKAASPGGRGGRRGREEDEDDDRGGRSVARFKPCPKCGCPDARRVTWTWWGSFYGPAMFSHVKCLECGNEYNGKTGGSNVVPMVLFVVVPLLLILGIIGGCCGAIATMGK